MNSNFQMFRRSLRGHPGLTVATLWPLMVVGAVCSRKDFTGFADFSTAAFVGIGFISLLPWVAVLWTAYTGRKQYRIES